MAPKSVSIIGAVLAFALVSTMVNAQSGCTSVIVSMASCLNYVSGSAATPTPSCCSALENVVKTQPRCLCTIVNGGGGSLGVNINQTLALGLPGVCKVDTPPSSRCNGKSCGLYTYKKELVRDSLKVNSVTRVQIIINWSPVISLYPDFWHVHC